METSRVALMAVGLLFVLPQIVGFITSRVIRRASAVTWALAAPVTVLLLGGESFAYEHLKGGRTRVTVNLCMEVAALLVIHLAAGAIFGVLDQRARTPRANY